MCGIPTSNYSFKGGDKYVLYLFIKENVFDFSILYHDTLFFYFKGYKIQIMVFK